MIGYMGRDAEHGLPFIVSREVFRTPMGMKWGGSARYATHERHATHALTEFTGLDPDSFSFDLLLTAELGVNPMEELVKLWNYERDGEAVGLVIGGHDYGKYRWVIKKHETKIEYTDTAGDLYAVEVSVELMEYLKGETHNISEIFEEEEFEEPEVLLRAIVVEYPPVMPSLHRLNWMGDLPNYSDSYNSSSASSSSGTYTVQPGDNLWTIAQNLYGSGADYSKIYEANQGLIGGNPGLIYPGQTLTIP